MLLSILVNPLGLLMAGTGIALGIVSVKIEIKPIGVVGMIVSLLCCIIAAFLVISGEYICFAQTAERK